MNGLPLKPGMCLNGDSGVHEVYYKKIWCPEDWDTIHLLRRKIMVAFWPYVENGINKTKVIDCYSWTLVQSGG